ncbi:lipase class 3 [Nitzschia inconspicua]|uniref:Lipase class 3 n=1 Tax=Nitzschia inconspicua TaxID=303405 RepID=A0A9K3KIZ6_9STRA|nr:lipase class 3 [Nitzschia inconspicua]
MNYDDGTKSDREQQHPRRCASKKNDVTSTGSTSIAVSTIPQILVALNVAFSLTKKKGAAEKQHVSIEDVATDESIKHCKSSGQKSTEDTVPTTIITTAEAMNSRTGDIPGEITFDSYDCEDDEEMIATASTPHNSSGDHIKFTDCHATDVKVKIQNLRRDLRNLQPKGVAGNAFFWWIHPVKWVSDPLFGIVESVGPAVASTVPFSDNLMALGLDATTAIAHGTFGVTKRMGIVTSSTYTPDEETRIRLLTQLLSLIDLSRDVKNNFIQAVCSQARHQRFLLGIDKDLYFSLTMEQEAGIEQWMKRFGGLYDYMKELNIKKAIEEVGGMFRYYENKAILGALQRANLNMLDRYHNMRMGDSISDACQNEVLAMFPLEDACRYVKFAVAAYGETVMSSADLELRQKVELRSGDLTRTRICEYIGIPSEDIEVIGVDYGTEENHLSHFVAVDHCRRKVILAIRGTHPLTPTDSFKRDRRNFLEGRAHSGIATMAENLWKSVSYPIIRLLHENPWYDLIVTGHSLGGGVTVLLNLLLHKDERIRGHNFRCYAFGSPPVYENIESVPKHVAETCVTYINQFDKVPFTSDESERNQASMIAHIERLDLDLVERAQLVLGLERSTSILHAQSIQFRNQVKDMQQKQKQALGQHPLGCPCAGVVWIVKKTNDDDIDSYDLIVADPAKVAMEGLLVHKNGLYDHFPARYEHFLNRLAVKWKLKK